MLVDTPSPLPHFSFETPPRAAPPFGRDLRLAGLAQTMPLIVCDAPKAQSGRITTLKPACSFGTLQTPHCGSAPAGESVTHKKMLRIGGTNSTSLLESAKLRKKRTQNELTLKPGIALRRAGIVQLGRLAQTLFFNVCDAPKVQFGQIVLLRLPGPSGHRRHETSGSAPAAALRESAEQSQNVYENKGSVTKSTTLWPLLTQGGEFPGLPSSDEEGLGVVGPSSLGVKVVFR